MHSRYLINRKQYQIHVQHMYIYKTWNNQKYRSMFGFSLIYHKFSSSISKSNVTITFSSILFVRVTFDRSPALFIQNYQRESLSRSRGVLEEGEEFLSYDTPLEYRSRVSYRWMGNESATDKGGRYTLVNRKK